MNGIDCTLKDILNVYKLYHNKLDKSNISNNDIFRCDKIIEVLGFDKEWAEYYDNSRKILTSQRITNLIEPYYENGKYEFKYEIPENILAIKELRIEKADKGMEAKYIYFAFEMPHHEGWFETYLPPKKFFMFGSS